MRRSPYSKAALKRGGWQFMTGKAVTALLTFLILLALVRLLPIPDYAAYVTFVAALELAYPVSSAGLPWMASRYLPEFRLHADGRKLRKVASLMLLAMVGLLTLVGLLMYAGLDRYLAWSGLHGYRLSAAMFLAMFVIEYSCRFLRENLLGPLMQQVAMRFSQVGRQLVFGGLLWLHASAGSVELVDVIGAELVAASVGALLAAASLFRHLQAMVGQTAQAQWQAPPVVEMWRTARNMYTARLLTLAYSPQALLLLVQRMLSAEAVALFGFLRSLYLQISNNLPATLLFSLIQPKLVASRVHGGIDELSRNANLAGKLSLFALMPLVAASAVGGEPLVAIASGAKFADSGLLFLGFMLVLVPFSQRLLLETVAVAAGHSGLCTMAALSGLVALPMLWALVSLGWGLWAPIATLAMGYWLFNLIVQAALVRRTEYRPDVLGTAKLLAAAVAGAVASLPLAGVQSRPLAVVTIGAVATVTCLAVAWVLKPFTQSERDRLNALFNRRFFVW